jgi:hypothetical protein
MTSKTDTNRRAKPRVQVSEQATLWLPEIGKKLDCLVEDISEAGARIRPHDVNQLPGSFRLTIDRLNFKTECIVVWRSDDQVGVVFESPPLI